MEVENNMKEISNREHQEKNNSSRFNPLTSVKFNPLKPIPNLDLVDSEYDVVEESERFNPIEIIENWEKTDSSEDQKQEPFVGVNLTGTDKSKEKSTSLSETENADEKFSEVAEESLKMRLGDYVSELVLFESNKGYLCTFNKEGQIPLANFIPVPLKEIIKDDGVEKQTYYLLTGKVNGYIPLKPILITSKEFLTKEWIFTKWGIKCILFPNPFCYNAVQVYISEQMENVPVEIKYTHVGWRNIKGSWVYLHANGAIGSVYGEINSTMNLAVEFDSYLSEYDAIERAIDMLDIANRNVTIPLFGFTLLSILKEPFKIAKHEPNFILWLVGQTGSRKTTLAKMFSNIFNRSDEPIIASFKDTPASIERKGYDYASAVTVVDDWHPTTVPAEKARMRNTAAYILRLFGDNVSRSRMNSNMTKQKDLKPRGLCLITGEDVIDDGASSSARFLSVEIDPSDVDLAKLSEHQTNYAAFSTFLTYFIEWISENMERIISFVHDKFPVYRDYYQKQFSHGRLGEMVVFLSMTYEILYQYLHEVNYLDQCKVDSMRVDISNVLIELVANHNSNIEKSDPAVMYLNAIHELMLTNKVRIYDAEHSHSKPKGSYIGFEDKDHICLVPDTTYAEVIKFFKMQGKEYPLSKKKTHEVLDNLNVIETTKESRDGRTKTLRTIKKSIKINGKIRGSYLCIRKSDMYRVLDISQSGGQKVAHTHI